MNMISTGAFQTEMDATSKLVKAWESKNAKNAAKAGGISMMALSLAACGSSSTTTTATTATDTTTTTVVTPTAQSFTLTSGKDAFAGGEGADTFASSGANFSVLDSLTGGSGADVLNITDTTGALEAGAPTGATLTGIETINVDASGGVGVVAVAGTAQVNDYAAITVTADVAGVTQYTASNATGADGAYTVTYNGNTVGYTGDSDNGSNTATNLTAAINTAAGSTVAYVGSAHTITSVSTGNDVVVTGSDVSGAVKVGMAVTASNGYTGVVTAVAVAGGNTTITTDTAYAAASGTTLTVGGGAAAAQGGVTIFGTGTAQPTVGLSLSTGYAASTSVAAVDGNEGDTVTVNYGGTSGTYLVGATATATGTNLAAAINSIAGATVAVAASGAVTVTAPTAGTALPVISFSGAGSNVPGVTLTTANVAGATGTQYDMSGYTGVTNVVAEAEGSVNLKLASTTDATITATSGAMALAGGQDLTLTHGNTAANNITVAAGKNVVVTAGKATTGDVTLTAPTGTVDVNYNGSFANTANATLGGVTVSSAGSSVDIDVTSGASGAALAATNYTVTQGAIAVTGGATTTSVAVSQDAAVTAVAGTTATGKIGVVQGGVTITDGALNTTGTDTLSAVTIENFGATTITSTVLDTLNVTADATNASGAVTIDKSGAGLETSATTLTVKGGGKIGAIDGTQADVYTTVAFNADTALTVADINFAAATAITAAGAGVTTITLSTDDAAVTSYTSTGGGLVLGATMGTAVSFTGGAGADAITIGQTTKANVMGAGNDTVTMTDVLGTGGSVDGGAGDGDILVINDVASGGFNNPAGEPRVTNFEVLNLGALANGSYSAAGFTAIGQGNTAAAVTYTNVAAGVDLAITATSAETLDVALADATGTADVFNISMNSKALIDYTASSSDITIAGVETINITSTDADTTAHVNAATLTATGAKTVTITGDTGFNLTATSSAAITTMDASGVTLALVTGTGITYDSVNTTVGANVTIKGSNGIDVLTGSNVGHDTITAGSGADTLVYDGGSDVFTGGAGIDTFDVDADGTALVHLTVTDLAVGDKVDLAGVADGTNAIANGAIGAITTLGAGATLAQYLDAAAVGNGGATTSTADWFQYDGDTYLVVDNTNATTFAATDSVVEFTGLIDLTSSTLATEILTVVAV